MPDIKELENAITKMEHVSIILKASFIAIVILTVWQFYKASDYSKLFLIIAISWMALQLLLGVSNFYAGGNTTAHGFPLLIAPPLVMIVLLFLTVPGKNFVDKLNMKRLTLLHTIRVPVEIVLYFLFVSKAVPRIMTFEGRNYDIIAGLTAPFIFYFVFVKHKISNKILIAWNVIGAGLLLNIVVIALLSAKIPFQQFGFDQPNIAIVYFPFNWLPSVVVPLVLLSHLAALRQLIVNSKKNNN